MENSKNFIKNVCTRFELIISLNNGSIKVLKKFKEKCKNFETRYIPLKFGGFIATFFFAKDFI